MITGDYTFEDGRAEKVGDREERKARSREGSVASEGSSGADRTNKTLFSLTKPFRSNRSVTRDARSPTPSTAQSIPQSTCVTPRSTTPLGLEQPAAISLSPLLPPPRSPLPPTPTPSQQKSPRTGAPSKMRGPEPPTVPNHTAKVNAALGSRTVVVGRSKDQDAEKHDFRPHLAKIREVDEIYSAKLNSAVQANSAGKVLIGKQTQHRSTREQQSRFCAAPQLLSLPASGGEHATSGASHAPSHGRAASEARLALIEGNREFIAARLDQHPFLRLDTSKTQPQSHWRAPSEWGVAREEVQTDGPAPYQQVKNVALSEQRFQCLMSNLRHAGAERLLSFFRAHATEQSPAAAADKHLWSLMGLRLLSESQEGFRDSAISGLTEPEMSRPMQPSDTILQLFGNLGDVFYQCDEHMGSQVSCMSAKLTPTIQAPPNTTGLLISRASPPDIPYAPETFNRICISSLASSVDAHKIVPSLQDCHSRLVPGGILEIRVIDPLPYHKTIGPKMKVWVESVATKLEKEFRCARPIVLLPDWIKAAGFSIIDHKGPPGGFKHLFSLPLVASETPEHSIDNRDPSRDQLAAVVGRSLWKDTWGWLIDGGSERSYWDDKEVELECMQYKTCFLVGTILATKSPSQKLRRSSVVEKEDA